MKNRIILILNASIGYFADKYGFYQIPVHLENNTEAILELNSIINLALNQNIKLLIIPNEKLREDAEKLVKPFEGYVEIFDPFAEDYIENMKKLNEIFIKYQEEK